MLSVLLSRHSTTALQGALLLLLVATTGCGGEGSTPTPTAAGTSAPVVATTPVRFDDSLFITVPAAYRLTDSGHPAADESVRIYTIDAVATQPNVALDRYSLWFYPPGSKRPRGFDNPVSLDVALQGATQILVDDHYQVEDSSTDASSGRSLVRIRALNPGSNELVQEFFLLLKNGSLIYLAGGGSLSRVPRSQQLSVFEQLSTSLLAN